MKRIHIIGKDLEKVNGIKGRLKDLGFVFVEENPDLVITYGGDGMFLIAERMFPGVLKLPMKDSDVGNKCNCVGLEEALEKYLEKDFEVEEIHKLKVVHQGRFETRELIGVNDIVVRNSLPTEAVRFSVIVEKRGIDNLIGDGVVVSTPYGSGGYFSSITREDFKKGIGIAFNNVTKFHEPLILSEDEKIEIEIIRGPAVLVADNNRDFINLENGDKIVVEQIEDVARKIIFDGKS